VCVVTSAPAGTVTICFCRFDEPDHGKSETIQGYHVHPEAIQHPAQSPNLNSYAERWVRCAKEECLSKLVLFGEALVASRAGHFDHFHSERNHQGKGNILLFPCGKVGDHRPRSRVCCHERLGGLLKYYSYAA